MELALKRSALAELLFFHSLMKTFNNTELFMGSELPYVLTVPKYSTISNANTTPPVFRLAKSFYL